MKQLYFLFALLSFYSVSAQENTNRAISSSELTPQGTPTGNSNEIGETQGELSVALTGAANYNLPIVPPPGINGIVPQISLSYNSQGGNSLAGYGWNVTGISSISRIPSTQFHDGTIDPVDFDNLDRFALDGQRLMIKNGSSGQYGTNGATYETESFSNVKITSYGVHPNGANFGPEYFIVEYPDGSKAYYGYTVNSRSILDWSITYWENAQGIRISYNYTTSNNSLTISTIKYGSKGTAPAVNEIQFVFENRQRPEHAYLGGYNFIKNNILREIKVIGNGLAIRNYRLAHEITSLGYERVSSITEKNGDNTKALNPTVFKYETTDNGQLFSISPKIQINTQNIEYRNTDVVSGDFDGDGKMDLILYPTIGNEAKKRYTIYTDINGSNMQTFNITNINAFQDLFPVTWLGNSNSIDYKLMPYQGWCMIRTNTSNLTSFSVNAKGPSSGGGYPSTQYTKEYTFPKFTFGYSDGCNLQRSIGLPPGNSGWQVIERDITKLFLKGDFNGDGLTDVIAVEKPFQYSYTQCGQTITSTYYGGKSYFINLDKRITSNFVTNIFSLANTANSKYIVADVNGDGKSDILVFDEGVVRAYSLLDNNQLSLLFSTNDSGIKMDKPILMGDYNGDGKADFVIPQNINTDNWSFYFSTGTSINKTNSTIGIAYNESQYVYANIVGWPVTTKSLEEISFIPSDINGDGKTDIIVQGNFTVECYETSHGCGYDDTNGNPQLTVFRIFENKGFNGSTMQFTQNYVNAQIGDVRRYPIPVFLDHNNVNQNMEYALVSGNFIRTFKSSKDNKKDVLLRQIITGNGVTESITYRPLLDYDPELNTEVPTFYKSSDLVENYPNYDLKNIPSYRIVSKIEKQSLDSYKKQLFAYHGAVSNVQGLGFLGFRTMLRTNWHNDDHTLISNVSRQDINKRGALYETFSIPHIVADIDIFSPTTDFINKSLLTYETEILPNKVFKIKNTTVISHNGLSNTSVETSTEYDTFNNPRAKTVNTKLGTVVQKNEITTIEYDQPTISPHIIGRNKKKNTTIKIYPGQSDESITSSEEEYSYNANQLMSQMKKKGHNTDYITENYEFDTFGNITKKTISALNLSPRILEFEYDTSGRFLKKSKHIDGLSTRYEYNLSTGFIEKEINPYGLETTHFYDSWGKKTKTIDYLQKEINFIYSKPTSSTKQLTTNTADGSSSIKRFDDFGREIISGIKNIDGSWSYTKIDYDIYDRKVRISQPYTDLNTGSSQFSSTTFDEYGRIIQTIEHTGKTSTISYNNLTTVVNDGNKTTTTIIDAIGNTILSTEGYNGTNNTINYKYYADGNLKESNFQGSKIQSEYDGWGRKIKLVDPSAGTYQYEYNTFGELIKELTPKGKIKHSRNSFGVIEFSEVESIDGDSPYFYYMYNPDGTLASKNTDHATIDGNQATEAYEYDNFKRPKKIIYNSVTAGFTKELTYDSLGRIEKEKLTALSYTNSKTSTKTFKYTYKNGYQYQILDDTTNQVLWSTNSINERGQLTNGSFGNGLTQVNIYDSYGFPSVFETKNQTGSLFNFTTHFDPIRGNLSNRSNSLFNTYEPFEYDNQDRLVKWNKEIVSIINTNFNAGTEEFGTQFGATTANQNGQLKVIATQAYAGVKKTLLTQAKIGDKLSVKVKIDKGTTNKVRVLIVEYNPANGAGNESFIGYAQNGIIEFEHTVSQYPYITLNIDKDGTGNDVGTTTNFYVDDLWVGKMITETQQYDERGRITENNLGQYNYTNTNKAYQNTSIDLNPETDVYYKNREGLFNDGMEEQKGWSDLGLGGEIFTKPVYDDSKSKTGKYSLKLYNPTTSLKSVHTDKWISISNTATTQYTYSGWVYSDGPDAQIQFFMKKDGEPEYFTNVDNYFVGTKNQWVYVEKTFNVPAHITKLNIRLDNNGSGNVWFDDIRIKKTTNPATSLRELNIVYNMFKKPLKIEETGVDKVSFKYNDSHFRTAMFYGGLQDDMTQRQFRKDYNFDGSVEITTNNITGESTFVFFVGGDAYTAPLVYKDNGTVQEYLYLHRDYQGSILAISNQTGNIVEKRLFDPWGNIVKVQDGQSNNLQGLTVLDRGYTGHEHIQSIGIINMNGRLYDPKLHRFLSPDNNIQDPYNAQNYNRYGYALNNPLKFTDPSGEFWHIIAGGIIGGTIAAINGGNIGDILKGAVVGAVAATVGAGIANLAMGASFFSSTAIGAISGFWQGAFIGGASGLAGAFAGGATDAWLSGASFENGIKAGVSAAPMGIISGTVLGGITGGIKALQERTNFWTGEGTMESNGTISLPVDESSKPIYSNEYAKKFANMHKELRRLLNNVDNLYADGSIPKGYTSANGYLINPNGDAINGVTTRTGVLTKKINVYLSKSAFISHPQLYMTMHHEFMHAYFYANNIHLNYKIDNKWIDSEHELIHQWQYDQIKAWNFAPIRSNNAPTYFDPSKRFGIPGSHYSIYGFKTINYLP